MESRRKILWDNSTATVVETPNVSKVLAQVASAIETATKRKIRAAPVQSGNGHKAEKKRDLEVFEKNKIETKLFIPNNGQIGPDMCVEFKMKHLPDDVAIFQVTGYVTALHGKVRKGKLHLRNMDAYEKFLREHQALWRTYDSPRYREMRRLPPVNQHRKPRFAAVATHR